jgi:hypothetical protein
MKPRFLADADLNRKIVLGLRRREPSIDFQTAHEGDLSARPDPEVLSIATRENRILVSRGRSASVAIQIGMSRSWRNGSPKSGPRFGIGVDSVRSQEFA